MATLGRGGEGVSGWLAGWLSRRVASSFDLSVGPVLFRLGGGETFENPRPPWWVGEEGGSVAPAID
jgi:hypothetical protein